MISDLIKKYDGVLISSWSNITYLTSYFGFSRSERECFLLFTKRRKYLITDGRYTQAVNKQTKGFEIIDIGANSFIHQDKNSILNKLKTLAVEEDNLTISEYKSLRKLVKRIKGADLSDLRIIKTANEIRDIKNACKIADNTFSFIIKELKIGVAEKEIGNKIEDFIRNHDAQISFPPIVAFGKNSAFPHHLSGQRKLRKNEIILLDFGSKVNNYCSDMSRTIFFGKANTKFKKMYQSVLEAQKRSLDLIDLKVKNHKSITAAEVDEIARDYILRGGFPTIPHSVGHGIGIEVHEPPFVSPESKTEIKPGMIFSIEPGIYDTSFGGVRIEDLLLIKEKGIELISRSRKEIMELSDV